MSSNNHESSIRLQKRDIDDSGAARIRTPVSFKPELVSIVIPCFGQLEYTKLCVPRLLRHARSPYEMIFVDVASLGGTAEYISGVNAAASARVELFHTDEDLGIAEAFDVGFARASGEFVVLLSNDTIVTPNWLDQLTALATSDIGIGAVGPMTNYSNPPQLVKDVPYELCVRATKPAEWMNALDEFARIWHDQTRGTWYETSRLDTFCILFNRETLVKIGSLTSLDSSTNPRTKLKAFDESKLGSAIQRAGWKVACCHDLFIHSFGSRIGVDTVLPLL
jgi:O-antigen biosynthesis protein